MLPYALHSPTLLAETLLAELGLNVKVLLEGEGISRRGTKDNTPFNGDVIRKMLDDMTPLEENPLEENPYLKPGDMVIEDNRGQRIS